MRYLLIKIPDDLNIQEKLLDISITAKELVENTKDLVDKYTFLMQLLAIYRIDYDITNNPLEKKE